MATKLKDFQDTHPKPAKDRVLKGGWPVYRDFDIDDSGDDVFVYAPRVAPEIPTNRGMQSIGAWAAEDLNRARVYAPLRDTPDLFLKFTDLGRKARTRDEAVGDMLDWIKSYGALGLEDAEGRGESLVGFRRALRNAVRCRKLYEAATFESGARDDPDVETLDGYEAIGETAKDKREWALEEVARIVGKHVEAECYPQLYRRVDNEVGRTVGFEQGWGFRSLLGAMYLRMMWLITEGGDPPRCKLEECSRIIRIGEYAPGDEEHAEESRQKGGRPRRYKTRKDKDFCSRNCKEKWRYHNVVKPRRLERAGQ